MKVYLAVLATAAVLAPAAHAARAGNPTTDVTANPVVQRDLKLAAVYWTAVRPDLVAPCTAERVLITPMVAAAGNDGTVIPASEVWAETTLDSCTIDISASMWQAVQSTGPQIEYAICTIVAHEYGHTLGLVDTATSVGGMMGQDPAGRSDPLCSRSVYGRASRSGRRWLAAHGLG